MNEDGPSGQALLDEPPRRGGRVRWRKAQIGITARKLDALPGHPKLSRREHDTRAASRFDAACVECRLTRHVALQENEGAVRCRVDEIVRVGGAASLAAHVERRAIGGER